MIHELNTEARWFDRIAAGDKRALVREHDRDFQVGDTLRLIRGEHYTYNEGKTWHFRPSQHFVGHDDRGRFVNNQRVDDPLDVYVTHVQPGPQADGVTAGYCVLSFEVQS